MIVDAAQGLVQDYGFDPLSPITVTVVDAPSAGGEIFVHRDGSFVYNPPAGFTGTETMTYRLSRKSDQAASELITVMFEITSSAPLAVTAGVSSGSEPLLVLATEAVAEAVVGGMRATEAASLAEPSPLSPSLDPVNSPIMTSVAESDVVENVLSLEPQLDPVVPELDGGDFDILFPSDAFLEDASRRRLNKGGSAFLGTGGGHGLDAALVPPLFSDDAIARC
ncbi:MAG: hypothetical protein HC824_14130 [Synechococcales cyanobacterium RM1_1_8]|nr:hypothetical protein [Synechococcales cyanobacterium RM1_1_8]